MRSRLLLAALTAATLFACSPRSDDFGPANVTPRPSATAARTTPTATAQSTEPTRTPTNTGAEPFDAARAVEHVRVLSVDIGERLSGTGGEDAGAAYLAGELADYGYDVEIQPFQFAPERYGLSFVGLPEGELAAYRLDGSGSGAVTAEAVYVGLGQQADVDAVAVAGKIAVADRGVVSFRSKYEAARDAGAVALVIINSEPGPIVFGNLDTTNATIPVVAVSQEDGPALMTVAEAGGELTVDVPLSDVGDAVNVFARPPGSARCLVLVGGHHDTVPGAPGANDNASGVGHVLELARVFAADGLDNGLCFATFGAEEHGLFGSEEMALTMAEDGELPEVMVNLDVTGIGPRVEVIGDERLRELALTIGDELGIATVRSSLPANAGSDHQSFAAQGVEVAFFTSGDFGTIHSPADVFEPIDEDEMERIGLVAQELIARELARIAGE